MPVVSGQVLDLAGQAVPGVLVYAVRVNGRRFSPCPTTHTDLSGRWALDLADGAWKVRETGHGGHEITVSGSPFTIGEQVRQQFAPEPTHEDIERLLARRKAANVERDIRDERDVDAPPYETRALVESPVNVGDMTAFLRERRGE